MLVFLIAMTLWLEARGEGPEVIRLVASVIWNRADGDPNNMQEVILKPKQFSCWKGRFPHEEDIPAEALNGNTIDKSIWLVCVNTAKEMINCNFLPITDANIYFNPQTCGGIPEAFRGLQVIKRYKNHIFMKE